MQLPNVEQLDSEDKNWFARAIAGMVVADGRVDESETAFLKEALGFLEDRSQVEQIMGIVKQGKPPEMPAAKIDSKQAFIMLKYLSELMVADAHLSPGEVRFFLYSGRLLGFTPDILTKLWKTARAQLEATLPKAVAQIGNQTVEITLTELHDSKFSFRFGQALTPNCKIILKLHRSDGSFWDPIACRMAGQHQDKFDQGSFSILGRFEQKVAEPHGILQILHPDQFTGHDENVLKPNKDSLMGRLVHCFLCNEPRVPHYVLRSRSMITAPNIFGVPAYEKPAGNLQFCDYNLIQITTCPKCGFSANDLSFFKRQNTDEPPFNVEKLNEVFKSVSDRIGKENEGWSVAKYLLEFERSGGIGGSKSLSDLEFIKRLINKISSTHQNRFFTKTYFRKVSELEIKAQSIQYTSLRILSSLKEGDSPGPESSMMKTLVTDLEQEISELTLDVIGYYGIPFQDTGYGSNKTAIGDEDYRSVAGKYQNLRATTIYGGSNEIQRNIMAKAVLGL